MNSDQSIHMKTGNIEYYPLLSTLVIGVKLFTNTNAKVDILIIIRFIEFQLTQKKKSQEI